MQHGRDTVGERSGASLVDAVILKCDVEPVVLSREVKPLCVAGPEQREGGERPRVVEDAAGAPEPEQDEGDGKSNQPGRRTTDTRGQLFHTHPVIACQSAKSKGAKRKGKGEKKRGQNRFSTAAKPKPRTRHGFMISAGGRGRLEAFSFSPEPFGEKAAKSEVPWLVPVGVPQSHSPISYCVSKCQRQGSGGRPLASCWTPFPGCVRAEKSKLFGG